MTAGYEARPWSDARLAFVTLALAVGIWSHAVDSPTMAMLAGTVALVVVVRADAALAAMIVAALLLGSVVGGRAWAAVEPRSLGPYDGWATLIDDPAPVGAGVRAVVEIEGERFRTTAYGSMRHRLARFEAGERVALVGERVPLAGRFPRRAQIRHIVGDLRLERIADPVPGTRLATASNRVRGQLRSGAERTMGPDDAALFTGLVIGDDARQQPATIAAFRAAGLSHLTAVSGQNVSYVIALAGLFVRALPRWWRLAVTLGLIAWFVVITRLEPSVLRAGTMAALSAVAFAVGRERSPTRLLALAVIVLLLLDPLLLWSVAFWLSTGATLGVTVVAPALERRLGGPAWLSAAVAVTVGAQVGVLLPSWLVFGRVPVLGLPANLLAVPVAGVVMLYGLPAGLLAAVLPDVLAESLMLPAELGSRWVAVTARVAAMLEPHGVAAVVVALVQIGAIAALAAIRWRHPLAPVER